MKIIKKVITLSMAISIAMSSILSANALTYNFEGGNVGPFAPSTSVEDFEYPQIDNNDYSKNTAFNPPGFGTKESYIPNRSEAIVDVSGTEGNFYNQVIQGININYGITYPGSFTGGTTATPPGFANETVEEVATPVFTLVTKDTYLKNGTLGVINIPKAGVNFSIYEGTSAASLRYGAGHYSGTSIWGGNVCLAGHNRGVKNNFGKIHLLEKGDKITLSTVYGDKVYEVQSVRKISRYDVTVLNESAEDMITLTTCITDQPELRYCVVGKVVN